MRFPGGRERRRRPRVCRAIRIRVAYHGEVLLELDSDTLHVLAQSEPGGCWHLLRGRGQDWPDIMIRAVTMPD